MDFEKLVEERYSVRKFADTPVEEEKLAVILKAGRLAPTACNYQPQRILIISGEEGMKKLKETTTYTFGAPMAILVCCDTSKSWTRPFDNDNSGVVDVSIVTTHMMLQAAELGLGTTWVGYFDPAKMKSAFAIPENMTPVALLPLGYPAADASINPLHFQKKPEEEIVFRNSFAKKS